MNDRNDYEPFEAQELIDNLNAAFAKRPVQEAPAERGRKAEEAAFRRYFKAVGEWERNVWEPAYMAVKEADVKLKYDYISGRYYARYDEDGRERYAIRVTCKRYFDVTVAADSLEEAKALALRAMDDEPKIARAANKKARFTYSTTAEDTSSVA